MRVPAEPHIFPTAADFRAWLERNHATANELWVGYYKKSAAKTAMTYAEAVDEALCFGWIDGLARSFGAEVHANRFTPRRKGSTWSAVNIAKMAVLEREGRLRPAGRKVFEERDRSKDASYSFERPVRQLPPEMERRLESNEAARAYWAAAPPGYRRDAVAYILDAKREATRERRLDQLIADSASGQ